MNTDIQASFNEWIILIENTTTNFRKHFSNITVLYESSDPASSIITNEALLEFKQTKADIIKHVSGIALLSQLKVAEQLKLSFKLANLIEIFQFPIKQMRDALDSTSIKELTSSDTSHLNQTTNMLHMIFNNYITNSYKLQQMCFDLLLHAIITSETISEIKSETLSELDSKYQCVSFYSALLHYIFKHFRNANLIENVEILKDRILGSTITKSSHPFTFQTFDLVGGKYQTLDEIFGLKLKADIKFDKIAKQLSIDNKVFDIIVITNPTSFVYNLWNLTENIEYDCIDPSTISQFETIKPVKSKVKLDMKIYKSSSKSQPTSKTTNTPNADKRYYYVLETYDNEHYRVMTPWQVFPNMKLQYIPQSWLPEIKSPTKSAKIEHYPSGRIEAYNVLIEKKILKYKGQEKDSQINPKEVNNEKGLVVDHIKTWFLDQTKKTPPVNLNEYRELLNSDNFRDHVESILVEVLTDKKIENVDMPAFFITTSNIQHQVVRTILILCPPKPSKKLLIFRRA